MIPDGTSDLQVVAGLLFDPQGRVLIAARPAGKMFAGRWEFPGGKVDAGEQPTQALVRELAEELGIVTTAAECQFFHAVSHRYPGATRAVRIQAYRIGSYSGTPASRENQALAWHFPQALPDVDILEADRPIITALRLGSHIDLAHPPDEATIFPHVEEMVLPVEGRHMAGVKVTQVAEVEAACAAGADFLIVDGALTVLLPTLTSCGLPWFAPVSTPSAHANGHWSVFTEG